jgi:hypothetical protein
MSISRHGSASNGFSLQGRGLYRPATTAGNLPLDLPTVWNATELNPEPQPMSHAIGPAGIVGRVAVGMTLIALALFWLPSHWLDSVLGFVVLPSVAIALLAWRARHHPMR